MRLPFDVAPQVVDHPQTELAESLPVLVGERMEGVGPEDSTPLGASPVDGGVTAEITEVDGAVERHTPLGRHQAAASTGRRHGEVRARRCRFFDVQESLPWRDGHGTCVVDAIRSRADGHLDAAIGTIDVHVTTRPP